MALKVTADTKLEEISLPYWDVVLAERFLLPPDSLKRFQIKSPETLGELEDATGIPLNEITSILEECLTLDSVLWLAGEIEDYTNKEDTWIVDMRRMVTHETEPLHDAARLFHLGSPAAQLAYMRTLQRVIVLDEKPSKAWSSAMSLRSMGVPAFVLDSKR